jgi:hypothetical protein
VKLKDRASFFSFFEKPRYEVCLIRIKEQVGERRSTVCTHRYIPCARKGRSYFAKHHSDSTKKFSETDIINMLEILIDNIFVQLRVRNSCVEGREVNFLNDVAGGEEPRLYVL